MYRQKFWCFAAMVVFLGPLHIYAEPPVPMHPAAMECMKEFNLNPETIWESRRSGNMDNVDPCYFACFFKKIGVIDSKGMYDLDKALQDHGHFKKSPEKEAERDEAKIECVTVNDVTVSDGDKGCERAVLLTKCMHEHKHDMAMSKEVE